MRLIALALLAAVLVAVLAIRLQGPERGEEIPSSGPAAEPETMSRDDSRQRLVAPSNDSTRAGLAQPSQDIAAEPAQPTAADVVVDAESRKQAAFVARLERMRNEVLSEDPQIQHGAAYALLGEATASILKQQGRVGRSGGGSMRQEYPSERVVGINDAVYRFDSVEFPAWDELNAFYDAHPDRQNLPSLPDELAYMIADLAEQAIVIERGK